jgi:hypothetical protein
MSALNLEQKKLGAAEIREYSTRKYVFPARQKGQRRFSIRVGDIVREHRLYRSIPAVCSALKTQEFLQNNGLRLVDATGPKSGLSTTVVYTYEFVDPQTPETSSDSWQRLRGALREVFAELGGSEAYLRAERSNFYSSRKTNE